MAKQRTERESAVINRVKEFMIAKNLADWGQREASRFICSEARRRGMEKEEAKEFLADLLCLGLGGNASGFAQAAGIRLPKAKKLDSFLEDFEDEEEAEAEEEKSDLDKALS